MCSSNTMKKILQDHNTPNRSQLKLEITIELEENLFKTTVIPINIIALFPVDTRRRFNVYATSIRRR